ncbi:T3SS (YopN, CesT) and YbjN peptide-binding chaperone 1 [Rhodococcus sp. NPDC054953]
MSDGQAFDSAVDGAWREFRTALADRLALLEHDDTLVLGALSVDRSTLLVTVDFWRAGMHLVCTARHDDLAVDSVLFDAARAGGWDEEPGHPDQVTLEVPIRQVDRAAAASVTVLRDIAGLTHPSFVHARTGAGPATLTAAMADAPVEPAPMTLPELEHPADPRELREAVARTLTWKYGTPPITDEDDDFPVTLDGFAGYVLPHPKQPQVRILVPLLREVTGRTRAAEVLADLNAELTFIRLTLTADQINAVIDLPGSPYAGAQLSDHLDRMTTFLRTLDDRFERRLGGRFCDDSRAAARAQPDRDSADDLPAGLLTLIQLDATETGTLDAGQVAQVCDHDRDTILRYLDICEEQVYEWRESGVAARGAGDDEEAGACDHEMAGWQATVDSLRAALRVVALGPPSPRQMELFNTDQPDPFD